MPLNVLLLRIALCSTPTAAQQTVRRQQEQSNNDSLEPSIGGSAACTITGGGWRTSLQTVCS
jgi:hypothetical protein